jgi:hypothetical protein
LTAPPISGLRRVATPPRPAACVSPPAPPTSEHLSPDVLEEGIAPSPIGLLERLRTLSTSSGALHACRLCMDALLHEIPSRAAFVHLHDGTLDDVFVVCAFGPDAEFALLSRVGEDPVLAMAVAKGGPVVLDQQWSAVLASCERFPEYAGPRQVLTAPVLRDGRLIAALEIADPVAAPFGDADLVVIETVAGALGEFLATNPSPLDVADVIRLCRCTG